MSMNCVCNISRFHSYRINHELLLMLKRLTVFANLFRYFSFEQNFEYNIHERFGAKLHFILCEKKVQYLFSAFLCANPSYLLELCEFFCCIYFEKKYIHGGQYKSHTEQYRKKKNNNNNCALYTAQIIQINSIVFLSA